MRADLIFHVKNKIGLSGRVNGVKFRLGIANPYTQRKPAVLGPQHLRALLTLLAFIDPSDLGRDLVIDETAFIRRFPGENILPNLKSLLDCWVSTSTGGGLAVFSTFAALSFYQDPKKKLMFVKLSGPIVPVLKGMIDRLRKPSNTPVPGVEG